MLKYLHLQNVGPASEMALEFGDRMNLITGDNGLGKSFLLDVAWWALTRKWPRDLNSQLTSGYAAKPSNPKKTASIEFTLTTKTKQTKSYSSTYSARDESWLGQSGRPWNPGLVIYAHADGSFSVWDPARNYWKKKGQIDVQDRLPGYVFSPREVWDGLQVEIEGRDAVVCNGLVRDWASWIREKGIAANNMEIVLGMLSPSEQPGDQLVPGPLCRIGVNDVRDIPTIQTGYSDAVPVLHASSGVRRIIALSYMLLWTFHEHQHAARQLGEKPTEQVILIVDELESHLHPRWQRSILGALLKLAPVLHSTAKIQLIAATHSPLVMASAEPNFDEKQDAWFDIDFHNESRPPRVELLKREFVRRGDVVSWLTSEAFDLREGRSLEAETAIVAALEVLKNPKTPTAEIERVNTLLQSSLSDTDRFWMRWSQYRSDRAGAAKK